MGAGVRVGPELGKHSKRVPVGHGTPAEASLPHKEPQPATPQHSQQTALQQRVKHCFPRAPRLHPRPTPSCVASGRTCPAFAQPESNDPEGLRRTSDRQVPTTQGPSVHHALECTSGHSDAVRKVLLWRSQPSCEVRLVAAHSGASALTPCGLKTRGSQPSCWYVDLGMAE